MRDNPAPLVDGEPCDEQHLGPAVLDLDSTDEAVVLTAVTKIRKWLSVEDDPPISKVLDAGGAPALVRLLDTTQAPQLAYECAWALTNLLAGTAEETARVLEAGVLPAARARVVVPDSSWSVSRILDTVRSTNQCVWLLGNAAGDSPDARDLVLSHGVVEAFVAWGAYLADHASVSEMRDLAWSSSNLCRGKPPPDPFVVLPLLPMFATLMIRTSDSQVHGDGAWGVAYLSHMEEACDAIIAATVDLAAGGTRKFYSTIVAAASEAPAAECQYLSQHLVSETEDRVPLLHLLMVMALAHGSKGVVTPVVRTIGNMASSSAEVTDFIVSQGVIPFLFDMLTLQLSHVIQLAAGLVGVAIEYLSTEESIHPGVTRELLFAVSNVFQHATMVTPWPTWQGDLCRLVKSMLARMEEVTVNGELRDQFTSCVCIIAAWVHQSAVAGAISAADAENALLGMCPAWKQFCSIYLLEWVMAARTAKSELFGIIHLCLDALQCVFGSRIPVIRAVFERAQAHYVEGVRGSAGIPAVPWEEE